MYVCQAWRSAIRAESVNWPRSRYAMAVTGYIQNMSPVGPSARICSRRREPAAVKGRDERQKTPPLTHAPGRPVRTPFALTRGKCRFQKVFESSDGGKP